MSFLSLGIDIAKLKFNVCLIREDGKFRHKVLANTAAGFAQLSTWLTANDVSRVHACLEATGTYGEALATYLAESAHRVSVINPLAIKSYAGCQLSRTKTDKVDAELIARFCLTQQPPTWTPAAPQIRTLQALVQRLDALIEMQTMELNRLAAGALTTQVEQSLQDHLSFLDAEIKRTEKAIKEHINSHPTLKADRDLLLSIPGIGEATTARLLSEINFQQHETARSVAAFTGLFHESDSLGHRCEARRGYQRLVPHAFVMHSTSRQSRPSDVTRRLKRGPQDYEKEESVRCKSSGQ